MALSDRVKVTSGSNSFKLFPVNENDREAYYGFFSLKDDPAQPPQELIKALYWDPKNCYENNFPPQPCFVYIEERKGGQVVEQFRFYRGPKNASLAWKIEPKRRYGRNAHMITLQWNGNGEAIHRSYIFLQDARGNKYPFITKTIGAPGMPEDQYIFILPEGEAPDGYKLGFDPLLLQKYNISVI